MNWPYLTLPSGRLIDLATVRMIDSLERAGHRVSIDEHGDVQVSDYRRADPDLVYSLQNSSVEVSAWLRLIRD